MLSRSFAARRGLETSAVTGSTLAIKHQPDPRDRIHLPAPIAAVEQFCKDLGHTVKVEGPQSLMGWV